MCFRNSFVASTIELMGLSPLRHLYAGIVTRRMYSVKLRIYISIRDQKLCRAMTLRYIFLHDI